MMHLATRHLRAVLLINVLMVVSMAAPPAMGAGETERDPRRYESRGEIRAGGERVRYRALVEEVFLPGNDGRPAASLVSTSYIRDRGARGGNRPVVFVFNGGPGSSSVWLHMGLVGPKRIAFGNEVEPETVPPFRLTDNAESILDVADVVLFDPPGTGYSRVLPEGKPEEFFGVTQDANATVRFIEGWINRHGRWQSPRFLMGESYGTIRAAVVARLLAGGPFATGNMEGITLNGVILLGQAMDRSAGPFSYANDLPSLAATAWYHGRAGEDTSLEEHVAAAKAFAGGDYLQALYAGSRLDAADRRRLAERHAGLTGLSVDVLLERELRVAAGEFSRALLSEADLQVGMYDSRFRLPLTATGDDPVADDPAMGQYVPGFVAGLNSYMRDELGVTISDEYRAIDFRKVNARWDYGAGPGVPSSRDFAPELATAMRRNPQLRLFIGSGYYDLVTTSGAAEYVVAHNDLPRDRLTMVDYESGHMPYLGKDSRLQLADDLRRFITSASRPARAPGE